ncbi:hypothetical protein [Spirosoma agri]|uniref:Uncharacterized protein n=1 Tax=Spirosoma agri TaxID=1987381 RepID=A0A6M0IQ23_9BACT|nr:hypothetical protein [Spirosoma agri]NEU69471.1 hypothetical protein [Spirosoma agri]
MKKHLFRIASLANFVIPFLTISCEHVNIGVNDRTETAKMYSQPITVSEAKAWFEQAMKTESITKSRSRSSENTLINFPKEPYWHC